MTTPGNTVTPERQCEHDMISPAYIIHMGVEREGYLCDECNAEFVPLATLTEARELLNGIRLEATLSDRVSQKTLNDITTFLERVRPL